MGNTCLNMIVTGAALSSHTAVPMVGYIGQIVSINAGHRNLSGPIFSRRVGVFYGDSPEGPWSSTVQNPARIAGEDFGSASEAVEDAARTSGERLSCHGGFPS